MNSLEKIKAKAQRDANRDAQSVAILNLNRVGSPLYVVRSIDPGIETCSAFVCIIHPEQESAQ